MGTFKRGISTDTSEPTFVEAVFEASVVPRRNILDVFYADVSCGSALAKGTIEPGKKGAFARFRCD